MSSEFGIYAAKTVDKWTAILDLAAEWDFKSIKNLAIKQLAPIASPVDKIVLGRKHGIDEWLADAYMQVCNRLEALTYEEGVRLGMADVITISAIRHECNLGRPSEIIPPFGWLKDEINKWFGLCESEVNSPVHKKPDWPLHATADVQPEPVERFGVCSIVKDTVPGYAVEEPVSIKDYETGPKMDLIPDKDHSHSEAPAQPMARDVYPEAPTRKLTTKKMALKKKRVKEAEAKAEREFQEQVQLERDLAEEAKCLDLGIAD